MALHPEEMDAAIIRNLPTKTGKTLGEWHKILDALPLFKSSKDAVAWLKQEHGVGHVSAQMIIRKRSAETRQPSAGDLFPAAEDQDLFDRLSSALGLAFPGTVATICKTYVGFGNPRQYAVAKPQKPKGLVVGLDSIDADLPRPMPARNIGGGDRIKWKLALHNAADIPAIVHHLSFGQPKPG